MAEGLANILLGALDGRAPARDVRLPQAWTSLQAHSSPALTPAATAFTPTQRADIRQPIAFGSPRRAGPARSLVFYGLRISSR